MRTLPDIVKQLIIVNVLFFFGSMSLGGSAYDLLALHYPQNQKFVPWQIATHMFMHGGVNHILFNMFGLWMFGGTLAQMWGRNKFLFFYSLLVLGLLLFSLELIICRLAKLLSNFLVLAFPSLI